MTTTPTYPSPVPEAFALYSDGGILDFPVYTAKVIALATNSSDRGHYYSVWLRGADSKVYESLILETPDRGAAETWCDLKGIDPSELVFMKGDTRLEELLRLRSFSFRQFFVRCSDGYLVRKDVLHYITDKPTAKPEPTSEPTSRLQACYHKCKNELTSVSFWLALTLGFPFEHFLWEKIPPFKWITDFLGL